MQSKQSKQSNNNGSSANPNGAVKKKFETDTLIVTEVVKNDSK